MAYQINGLKDIHKLLMNERKIGGVIEVNTLRLRTGEVYPARRNHPYRFTRIFHLFNWIYDGRSSKHNC